MNYTKLFYWLTVADNAKALFVVFIIIFTIISVVSTIGYFVCCYTEDVERQTESDKAAQRMARKWMWWAYPFMIFFWSLYVFTPSKRDALLIVAGGQTLQYLTTDSTAKKIPHELTSFVVSELKNMAKSAEVSIDVKTQKEKILDQAKKMSSQEIIEKMKEDTTFAKLILDK